MEESFKDLARSRSRILQLMDGDCNELIGELPVAVYTCDEKGRIIYYNEAAATLWGRSPLTGQDLWCGSYKVYKTDGTLLSPDEYPTAIALKHRRSIKNHEIIIEQPGGIRLNVLANPKPMFDDNGKVAGAINMLVDITSKKHTDWLLHENEQKYQLLSQSIESTVTERTANLKWSEDRYHAMIAEVQDYAILLLDKEGFILNWNKGAEKIKGYSEKEIIGKNFKIFYQEEDRREKLPERLIAEASAKGRAMHEGWRLRKDGSRFWGSIVITALHDKENNIIGYSKVTRDLTEKKLADDQIKQYSRELEAQNKELAAYAYVASHDLQEPLRKIQTFANLLEENIDDRTAVTKYLEKIHLSARRMGTLIRDVLNYSQVSSNDNILVMTDLNEVIKGVKEDFELKIEQAHATLTYSTLPTVKGIPVQLRQLFSNLLGNALKFSKENPVIEIAVEKIGGDELNKYPELNSKAHYFEINFKDNGVGFEQEYADDIFKLFRRLHSGPHGTGIGLSLCKKIVDNHKGYITVLSIPNEGTTFTILLPAP